MVAEIKYRGIWGRFYSMDTPDAQVLCRYVKLLKHMDTPDAQVYSVTPKTDRRIFVNNEKINKKYQFLIVRFIKVIHPPRYGEI